MQIKNKIFPYPILNNDQRISNFLGKTFELLFNKIEQEQEIKLQDIHFETTSEYLINLYKEKKIKVVVIVECSNTVYRKYFEIGCDKGRDLILFKADLDEAVYLSMFAYAVEDFEFISDEIDEDYKKSDVIFAIEKYDIIAANDGYNFRVIHQADEENLVKSIFSIVVDHELKDGAYKIDYESSRKINIYLSDEDYKQYRLIYSVPSYKEVFFNILLIPVLTEAFAQCEYELKNNQDLDIEDLSNHYLWFRSVVASYKKIYGIDLTKDNLLKVQPIVLAQEIMGKPLGTSFKSLVDEMKNKGDINDE